jgi:cell division protein FtsB
MASRIKTVLISLVVGLLAVASFLLGRRTSASVRVVIPQEELQKARVKAEAQTDKKVEQIRQQNSGKTVGELVDFLNERARRDKK